MLRVNETSATEAFTTHEESEDYQQRVNYGKYNIF